MSLTEILTKKLTEAFPTAKISVQNPQQDGAHFEAEIITEEFEGLSRIAQHKKVHAALGDLLKDEVHALAITTKAK
ncbi:MAG: BolA family transcriptional regulator [Alphaproteobacteria bacterium CG_4_10_14_0_8_um_filter_53_9]|nr:MAG: BolA family transcriptional regulator [Alphaproteobacteria bacterium CG_4_10_14_0_8_um_filter_53_9]